MGLVAWEDPASLDEQIGQGRLRARAPRLATLGELVQVDQVGLEGQYAEEEVAFGVHSAFRSKPSLVKP
jgi:hypothetical protein